MTIPRGLRSADCETCNYDGRRLLPAARATVAEHRYMHRRVDRRREQYLASKARKRLDSNRVGALHDLGCDGRYCTLRGCKPIPMYRKPAA